MYKEKKNNIEVYFICYKKNEMDLIETYYDEVLNTHCWYLNAYLAYKHWKKRFKNIILDEIAKMFLTVGASRYILYKIDNKEYKNNLELKKLVKELKTIEQKFYSLIDNNNILLNL